MRLFESFGMRPSDLHPNLFNGLPLVEAANTIVTERGLTDTMLRVMPSVFMRHNLANAWGVTLTHRHWNIGKGEVPVEQRVHRSGGVDYMMQPVPASHASGAVPCALKLYRGVFRALEFSDGECARKAFEQLDDEFLGEVAQALTDNGLDDHFGLRSLRTPEHNGSFVELTADDRPLSVTREMSDFEAVDYPVLQTLWTFGTGKQAAYCGKYHGCDVHSALSAL